MLKPFYSHGKLLLTGEYAVLGGAKSLAIPCKKGQKLIVNDDDSEHLIWKSFDQNGLLWFEIKFKLPSLEIEETTDFKVGLRLKKILVFAKKRNSSFLNRGAQVEMYLEFDRKWGLGSSSTLISNIANWANINSYELLENSFGGSGYDLACAQANGPICFTRNMYNPEIENVSFNPPFSKQLFFIYLNKKQSSQKAIRTFKVDTLTKDFINKINKITEDITECKSQEKFNFLLLKHESLLALLLNKTTVQKLYFKDFKGVVKSLGAWGGDFVLASGNDTTFEYFKDKGFRTIIPFEKMIHNKH